MIWAASALTALKALGPALTGTEEAVKAAVTRLQVGLLWCGLPQHSSA